MCDPVASRIKKVKQLLASDSGACDREQGNRRRRAAWRLPPFPPRINRLNSIPCSGEQVVECGKSHILPASSVFRRSVSRRKQNFECNEKN